jgi:hypothetical protein
MNRRRLEQQARHHATECERHARIAFSLNPKSPDQIERIRYLAARAVCRAHACQAFALSAQAARS